MAGLDDKLMLGTCQVGMNKDRPLLWELPWLCRHALGVGASGSGKTVVLKILSEHFLARGIPVVAVDVMADISSLAIPDPGDGAILRKLNLRVPPFQLMPEDRAEGNRFGALLADSMISRILTPCSEMGERLAISPLTPRPKNYDKMAKNDRDFLVLQADTAAANLMMRLGLGIKTGRSALAPDLVRGIITDAIMDAWDKDLDIAGAAGLQNFTQHLEQWGTPPVPDEAMTKFKAGVQGLMVGAEALWMDGVQLDFEELLRPVDGRTPFISINIAHIQQDRHPWIVSQVIYALSNWASQQGAITGRPRVALFLDELRGSGTPDNALLPPGSYRSLSGEAIRRVLRQGRHWGLTLLAGTQSPRDIDSTTFPNFANRFVGKLSTATDVDIVLKGADVPDKSRTVLERMISTAIPGRLFAIAPDGRWECMRTRGLAGPHMKLNRDQIAGLYEHGLAWKAERRAAPGDDRRVRMVKEIERMVAAYGDVLTDEQRNALIKLGDYHRR